VRGSGGRDDDRHSRSALLARGGPIEVEHLVARAHTYATEADQLLDLIDLREGADAVDVGWRRAGDPVAPAGRVGEGGRVGVRSAACRV
jgi:hypothetical protein